MKNYNVLYEVKDGTGRVTELVCSRPMEQDEVDAFKSLGNFDLLVKEGGILVREEGFHKVFRLRREAAQCSSPDATPMPEDMSEATAVLAKEQVSLYQGQHQGVACGPQPEPEKLPDDSRRGVASLGLNTEDAGSPNQGQCLSEDAKAFPRHLGGYTFDAAVLSEEERSALDASLAKAIISAETRAWANPDDIVWARDIVEKYLLTTTDIAQRRIGTIAYALADTLVYGLLKRKHGTGIDVPNYQAREIYSKLTEAPVEPEATEPEVEI